LIDRDDQWIICEIDQAVKDLNLAEFKRIGLLSKKIIRQSVIGVALSKCAKKGGNH
jgi:hypothetical protein